jgi:NAD dependent epimerase/dehydratase family enzyme
MKLVIAGATGLIGSILTDRLWNQFHDLTLLSRRPPAEVNVTKKRWLTWQPGFRGEWEKAVGSADGVINLAGEPIAGKRWNAEQKEILRSSRIDATKSLVNAVVNAKLKPKFLINASAVGYYGPHGDEPSRRAPAPVRIFFRVCVSSGKRKQIRPHR